MNKILCNSSALVSPDTVSLLMKVAYLISLFPSIKAWHLFFPDIHSKALAITATNHNSSASGINIRSSTMLPGELTGLQYLASDNQILIPANVGMMQNIIPAFHFNRFLTNLPNSLIPPPAPEFTSQSSSISNNSTSDEAEEHQMSIIDERKQRRMISNRESARRSRMRKQKHLDELWSQVIRLRNENHSLIDKLNHVSECQDQVLQENARLKEEASELRQLLTELKIGSPHSLTMRELEEVPCNTAHLRAEFINQSIANSVDVLH